MKLKVRATAVAALLGLVSLAASAGPLDAVTGTNLDWKLIGASTESSNYTTGPLGGETWSIGRITEIDKAGNPLYTSGDGGDYLTYMLYGAVDRSQTTGGGLFTNNIFQTGGTTGAGDGFIHLDIYRNSVLPPAVLDALLTNRNGFGSFIGITDLAGPSTTNGIPYLQMVLVPGIVTTDDGSTAFDETTTELYQNATALTLPATGTGKFYASIIGGSGMAKWNTDGFALPGGLFADFFAGFDLTPNSSAPNVNGLLGKLNDPAIGNAIPEPGSLALFGLALAAFGVIRRRDNKK